MTNKDAYWWKLYHEKAISLATLREMLGPPWKEQPLWGPKYIDPLIDDAKVMVTGNKAEASKVARRWYDLEKLARKEKKMSTTAHFQGGPLDGTTRTLPEPIQEYRVPVFKDLPVSVISEKTHVKWEDLTLATDNVVYERWAKSSQDSWYRVRPKTKALPYIEDPDKEEKLLAEEYVNGLIAAVRAVNSKIYADRRGSLPPYAAQHVHKSQLLLSEILIELKYALMAIDGGR